MSRGRSSTTRSVRLFVDRPERLSSPWEVAAAAEAAQEVAQEAEVEAAEEAEAEEVVRQSFLENRINSFDDKSIKNPKIYCVIIFVKELKSKILTNFILMTPYGIDQNLIR